jgi:hypothetical protein
MRLLQEQHVTIAPHHPLLAADGRALRLRHSVGALLAPNESCLTHGGIADLGGYNDIASDHALRIWRDARSTTVGRPCDEASLSEAGEREVLSC